MLFVIFVYLMKIVTLEGKLNLRYGHYHPIILVSVSIPTRWVKSQILPVVTESEDLFLR